MYSYFQLYIKIFYVEIFKYIKIYNYLLKLTPENYKDFRNKDNIIQNIDKNPLKTKKKINILIKT